MAQMFEEQTPNLENFRLSVVRGQNILEFLPGLSFAVVRLFMRGPLLEGLEGRPSAIRDRLTPEFLSERPLIAPRQVHGVRILESVPANALPEQPEADGVLLTGREVEASLRFADCAPVVVAPSDEWAAAHSPWVLLLHSGYKGTVQNIVRSGLVEVERLMGRDALSSASAWVGPCIAGNSYPRTMEEWTERGLDAFHPQNVRRAEGHFHFDIAGEIREQLLECGTAAERVHLARRDTAACGPCYSYRGGDSVNRMFLHARIL